jgi:hypothetical protein
MPQMRGTAAAAPDAPDGVAAMSLRGGTPGSPTEASGRREEESQP